ncbi:MAG: type II toxin-antitoxin system HipA family toxin [Oceanospirillaceae bacterium]|nr:type II toxin-antitoxin system HipA family toxin [Oceanospirillaceae bacterium]
MLNKHYFDLHVQLKPDLVILAGEVSLYIKDNGRIEFIDFAYTDEYLSVDRIEPLTPAGPPLLNTTQRYMSDGRSLPGFIDDLLPDDWGKRVIASQFNSKVADKLLVLNQCHKGCGIGAYRLSPKGLKPNWSHGTKLDNSSIDRYSENLIDLNIDHDIIESSSLVGGAQPKGLIQINGKPYLLKLNAAVSSSYNSAILEHAALETIRSSGLRAPNSQVISFKHETYSLQGILIERFDIKPNGCFKPMVSINSLLKSTYTQEDPANGSYEDIARCIRDYSCHPVEDLKQLFFQLLLNEAIGNTDDHLRNFAMIKEDSGWQLSPAYDVVPQEHLQAEHAISFNKSFILPRLELASDTAKKLGLTLGEEVNSIQQTIQRIDTHINSCQ